MNIEEEYWDLLEAYASNELNVEMHNKVKAWLETNKDAQTTLLGINTLMEEMPEKVDRDQFHKGQIENIVSGHTSEIKQYGTNLKWFWAAAIIVVVASVTYFFLNSTDTLNQKLAQYLSEPYAISDQVRSGASQETQDWIKAYKTADYSKTIDLLTKSDSLTSKERLYLGLSYLYNDQDDLSIDQLNEPFGSPYLDPQRKWYLALAYLQSEQSALAIPILEELQSNKSFKATEAKELLALLGK